MANKFWPAGKNFVAAAISLHSTCSGQISAPDRRASAKRNRERKKGRGRESRTRMVMAAKRDCSN